MSNSLNPSNLSKVTWILERDVFAENSFERIKTHLKESGNPFHVITILPFVHTLEKSLPHIDGPIVALGSSGIVHTASMHDWKPGVWIPQGIEEGNLSAVIKNYYLNHDCKVMMISEVPEKCSYMQTFFIKPNTDTKEFSGTIMTLEKFPSWYENMKTSGYLEHLDFEVAVSSPKDFGTEYRLVVCDEKIIGASQYRKYNIGKNKEIPEVEISEFQGFVTKLETMFKPAPIYVVDVTYDEFGYCVVEYGTFNYAGLYECNIPKLIDSINKYVVDNHAL